MLAETAGGPSISIKLDGMGWRDEEYQKFSVMRGGISRALCDWKTQYNIEQCRWW